MLSLTDDEIESHNAQTFCYICKKIVMMMNLIQKSFMVMLQNLMMLMRSIMIIIMMAVMILMMNLMLPNFMAILQKLTMLMTITMIVIIIAMMRNLVSEIWHFMVILRMFMIIMMRNLVGDFMVSAKIMKESVNIAIIQANTERLRTVFAI